MLCSGSWLAGKGGRESGREATTPNEKQGNGREGDREWERAWGEKGEREKERRSTVKWSEKA